MAVKTTREFISNHDPLSYRFRDKPRFQWKIAKFSYSSVFCAPAEGVLLGMGTGAQGSKVRMMALPGRERSLTIASAVWIQSTNVTDRQTDRHRATAKTTPMHSVTQ